MMPLSINLWSGVIERVPTLPPDTLGSLGCHVYIAGYANSGSKDTQGNTAWTAALLSLTQEHLKENQVHAKKLLFQVTAVCFNGDYVHLQA